MNRVQTRPYDAEVEYLEVSEASGGLAYIDTLYIPTGYDNDFSCKFMITGYSILTGSSGNRLFGAYTDADHDGYRITKTSNFYSYITLQNGGSINNDRLLGVEFNKIYNIIVNHDGTCEFNGDQYKFPINKLIDKPNSGSLQLFQSNPVNNGNVAYLRCYSFRWNKAGVPVLDLIPVRVGEEGYMYDRVSGRLFGNSGTGRFILGPDMA